MSVVFLNGKNRSEITNFLNKKIIGKTLVITDDRQFADSLIKNYIDIDVVDFKRLFSFINEKINGGKAQDEFEKRLSFINKLLKNDEEISLNDAENIYSLAEKIDESVLNDYKKLNLSVNADYMIEKINAISNEDSESIVTNIIRNIETMTKMEEFPWQKIIVDKIFKYNEIIKTLILTLISKAENSYIVVPEINKEYNDLAIAYEANSSQGSFYDKLCSEIRLLDVDDIDYVSVDNHLSQDYIGNNIYSKSFDIVSDEANFIADRSFNILEADKNSRIAVIFKDLNSNVLNYIQKFQEKGLEVNVEGFEQFSINNVKQFMKIYIKAREEMKLNGKIDGGLMESISDFIFKDDKEILRKFFLRFGNDVEIAIDNAKIYDKESAALIENRYSTIKKILEDEDINNFISIIEKIDIDIYSCLKSKEINISCSDFDTGIKSLAFAINGYKKDFILKDGAVNIISLEDSLIFNLDYVFISGLMNVESFKDKYIDDLSIRKINESSLSLLLTTSDEEKNTINSLNKLIADGKKIIYLSYYKENKAGDKIDLPTFMQNMFDKYEIEETYCSKDKLFSDLSEALYRYKETGVFEDYGKNAYRILSEDPKNIRVIKNIAKKIINNDNSIDNELVKKLMNDEYSVTRVEGFNRCPFKHMVDYGFNPISQKLYEENHLTRGTFFHNVISAIGNELWGKDLSEKEYLEEAKAIAERIMDAHNEKVTVTKEDLDIEKDLMIERVVMASLAYKNALDKGDYKLISTEYTVSKKLNLDNGDEINLTGIIDRIDEVEYNGEKYARIIDYKTSPKSLSEPLMNLGLQLQLPIYSSLLSTKVSGLYYAVLSSDTSDSKNFQLKGYTLNDEDIFALNDKNLSEPGYASDVLQVSKNKNGSLSARSNVKTEEELKNIQDTALHIFKETVEKIKDGNNDINPTKIQGMSPCEYCKYKSICFKK